MYFKRCGWLCFMLMGFYLCCTHMQSSILRYLRFQSQEHFINRISKSLRNKKINGIVNIKLKKERPSINKNHKITFPKVTLCLNSMHSKRALEEFPSESPFNLRTAFIIQPSHFGLTRPSQYLSLI